MIKSLPYKTKQFFFVLIKVSIVLAAFYFIYKKLVNNSELRLSEFIELVNKNDIFSFKKVLFLAILSSFNWLFEILKWKTLVTTIEKIDFKNATAQTLGSLTASLFTPNRIGEYGAKAMYYIPSNRKRIMGINLISNLLQMFVTCLLGIVGFFFFIKKYNPNINYSKFITIVLIIGFLSILVIYIIKKSRLKTKHFSLENLKQKLLKFSKKTLGFALFYSFIRYTIFSFQFYVLLQLFYVNTSYFDAMTVITSMYLISSTIPSIFLFDVLIKGSVAVYLFSFLNINPLLILSIITLMWLFNFVLPSSMGSYYVLNYKLPKNNKS